MPIRTLADRFNYPLLDVFWTLLWIFLWIMWIFLLVRILNDVFRSRDLSGGMKAVWTIALILFPFLAALVYLIVRGARMHEREQAQAAATDEAVRAYIQSAAGTSPSVAEEITKLADLHERGELSDAEFAHFKSRLMMQV
jgi:Na+/proline symporter